MYTCERYAALFRSRRQRHVARVGQLVGVGDRLAGGRVGERARGLGERELGRLDRRHGGRVLVGVDRGRAELRVGGRLVDDRAGVQVGLGGRVGGRAGDEGTRGQVRRGRGAGDRGQGVVGDRVGRFPCPVALVGQLVGVGDRLAGGRVGERARGLGERELGRLDRRHGGRVLV